MKRFLNMVTNNSIGMLKRPITMEIFQSVLQGQPYFIILMVIRELLVPLIDSGAEINYTRLIGYNCWLVVALVLLFLVGRATYTSEHSAAYTISSEGRLALGDHLRRLSMGFFKGRDPGDITALMLQDYTNVETMVSHLLMDAVGAVVLPLVFLVFLIPFHWKMALITVIPVPIAVLMAFLTQRIILKIGRRQMKAKNEASSRMLEYLNGIQNIKAFNLHGKKFERLKTAFDRLRRMCIRLEASGGPTVIIGVWFLNAGIALIMLSGVAFIISGNLSVPDFFLFLIVGTRMYDPLSKVLTNFAELSYYSISAGRIKDIFETPPLAEPSESNKPEKHDIEFRNVRFHYHDTDVLKDIDFFLEENTMTALVGPSGSGKTTVTRLIARFWDVAEGEIRIGGVPLNCMRSEDLLSMISIVFQDVYLFNDTILGNIRVGRADATMDEVRAAAEKARCSEFIDRLPQGYNAMVGEGGATLSGGEKQRISIARALLKNAPIVLLDEATASLDPENELYIQEAIGELVKGRTLIVIAHRLSTVTRADRILVLKEGEIIERGTHRELLNLEDGFYRRMWDEQRKAGNWKVTHAETACVKL